MKKIFLLLSATALFFACTSQSVDKGTPSPDAIALTEGNLAQGKSLYESNCGKCHALPVVSRFDDERWRSLVSWMAPKAKFNIQQTELVYLYVSNNN